MRLDPNPRTKYKIVTEVPPYKCKNFKNSLGYRIQVGKKSFINIPLDMLEILINDSKETGIYNRNNFLKKYPKQIKDKPCYVHAIGKLLQCSGIAVQENGNYIIQI